MIEEKIGENQKLPLVSGLPTQTLFMEHDNSMLYESFLFLPTPYSKPKHIM